MIKKNLYAILDTVADDLVGGIMLDTHDAPVARLFREMATRENTKISIHLADFELVRLGTIDAYELSADYTVILTGKKIIEEMQTAQERERQLRRA